MQNLTLALDGAWRVLLAGLLLGAGLPVLFAFGIRALSFGGTPAAVADGDGTASPTAPSVPATHPIGKVLGGACFAVVIAGVALGITFVVATGFGKTLSFEHVYPTVVAKQ